MLGDTWGQSTDGNWESIPGFLLKGSRLMLQRECVGVPREFMPMTLWATVCHHGTRAHKLGCGETRPSGMLLVRWCLAGLGLVFPADSTFQRGMSSPPPGPAGHPCVGRVTTEPSQSETTKNSAYNTGFSFRTQKKSFFFLELTIWFTKS